jgi:hypothetical protein
MIVWEFIQRNEAFAAPRAESASSAADYCNKPNTTTLSGVPT